MIFRLSLTLLRLFARVVPARDRDEWLAEWESELHARRARLTGRHRLTHEQELDMFRRILGSFRDAAWLRHEAMARAAEWMKRNTLLARRRRIAHRDVA